MAKPDSISSNIKRNKSMTNNNNGSVNVNLVLASEVRKKNEEASKKARVYFKVSGSVLITNQFGRKESVKLDSKYEGMRIIALSGRVDEHVLKSARSLLEQQIRGELPLGIERQLRFEKVEVILS